MSVYPQAAIDHFWAHVQQADGGGCWLWTGPKQPFGYGVLRRTLSHRFSWKLHYGDIPAGLCVCHHCDVPGCVRPDHLWLGTHTENHRDMEAKGRLPRGLQSAFKRYPEKYRGEAHWARRFPERIKCGADAHHAKLTEEQAQWIIDNVRAWGDVRNAAQRFNVANATIQDIIQRRTWKHLGGDPRVTGGRPEDTEGRLWSKVEIRGPEECWLWRGAGSSRGHTTFHYQGHDVTARSVAYRLCVGAIPPKHGVFVLCGESLCMNPSHMEVRKIVPGNRWAKRRNV